MEETIGYEALFSAEEWDAIGSGEWSGPDDWGSSKEGEPSRHSVFVANPPGTYEGNEERFELECDVCDYIGAVSGPRAGPPRGSEHQVMSGALC